MRKRLVSAFAMLSTVLLLSASFAPSLAADYTKVEVKVGDRADYSFASSDSKMNGAEAHVYVQSIEGTIVRINGTIRYSDGTVQTESIGGDVSKGQNNSYYFLICTNLMQGDPVYSGSEMKITETISANVSGASRNVNHMSSETIFTNFDVYWDKSSGLMVKLTLSGFGQWITVLLTNTSAWSPSGPPSNGTDNGLGPDSASNPIGGALILIVGVTVAISVITAVIVSRRRRSKARK
jgi:hypothetical protein